MILRYDLNSKRNLMALNTMHMSLCISMMYYTSTMITSMNRLLEVYRINDVIVREQEKYLGDDIEKVQLDDGSLLWSMTSIEYVTNAFQNLEDTLARDGAHPLNIFGKKTGKRKFPLNYCSKLDVSPLSDDTLMIRYLQLIGVLRCEIELGRINIMAEVSVLSQH